MVNFYPGEVWQGWEYREIPTVSTAKWYGWCYVIRYNNGSYAIQYPNLHFCDRHYLPRN